MLWQSGIFRANESVMADASWTRSTSSARRASPSWPRTRPSATRRKDQHRRHARPLRLRRRGRAHAQDGRRRHAAGRRLRGAAAADALRALEGARAGLPPIVVINKIDRPDARTAEVLNEIYDLFIDLDASESSSTSRCSTATPGRASPRRSTARRPRSRAAVRRRSCDRAATRYGDPMPLQLLITSMDYDDYVGRLAIGASSPARSARAATSARRLDGSIEKARSRSSTASRA
jgi:hypothetical protein